MTGRERVTAALEFRSPDVPPLRLHPSPGGLYDHGEKLLELLRACGSDFGETRDWALPEPPAPGDFGARGHYRAVRTDEWGTVWEHNLFGVWGHPLRWPLDDWAALDTYVAPAPPAPPAVPAVPSRHFTLGFGGLLFERMHSLRRFEDVLMDLALETPEIGRLADLICEHNAGLIAHALAAGVDGVAFGDDFGTAGGLIVSPAVWRRFFKPRYAALFEPIRRAGRPIFFHSCGQISALLDDLAELGVKAIWPQLPLYDPVELSRRCRSLGMCLELHPDRGDLMQRASPACVRDYLHETLDLCETASGGSWLYLEIDPGFAWPNVEMLLTTAMELRRR